ncbi:electron transport complex subunit RsxC [Arhodomonas sp. AD133]|uniref:electron transport complex subunit RsxC n=1 Tax=Arhodomonas sp. AD133 TaxID=3415009 RepID=UPI003EBDFEB6
MRALHRFPGGLRLDNHKEISTARPVMPLPLPGTLVLPLGQHVGAAGKACVEAGERVLGGQALTRCLDYVSAPIHAPTSGTVTAVEDRLAPHPSGLTTPCIVLEPDGNDEWEPAWPALPWREASTRALRQRVRDAGIAGLGGAAFPTAVKLNPTLERDIHTLIVNGAECEPWITCDDMLLRARAGAVVEGARVMAHMLGGARILLAVEDDMPEAKAAAENAAGDDVEVVTVPARYPAGGERQLIYTLTGEEVPSGDIPASLGIVCQNVGTAAAVHRAVNEGRPFTHRYVTVTGDAVTEPRVLEAPLGAPFTDLLEAAGGTSPVLDRLIMGGPMMGFTVERDDVPVIKATNCVLAASVELFPPPQPAMPCIRCGACSDACPVSLLPQQLYWHARATDLEQLEAHDLFDCIECGICAYVCPSHIPLVQYFRYAKGEAAEAERARRQAELSRERYEARQARLEREAEERRRRRERKKAAMRERRESTQAEGGEKPGNGQDERKAAIAAALAKRRKRHRGSQSTEGEEER